jgi:DNA-directed RNA polymerase subunit E'
MFELISCQDVVRIPPQRFGGDIKTVSVDELNRKYEGALSKELGYVITVTSVEIDPVGKILPGDGATYHPVNFKLVTYRPEVQEVVEGEVVEIGDFGAFIRIGPVEALLHISQIIDDYMSYDEKQGILAGKGTQRKLVGGDRVRGRVTAVSIAKGGISGKIGLTMRQPFLGKLEWIKEDLKKLKESQVVHEKAAEAAAAKAATKAGVKSPKPAKTERKTK